MQIFNPGPLNSEPVIISLFHVASSASLNSAYDSGLVGYSQLEWRKLSLISNSFINQAHFPLREPRNKCIDTISDASFILNQGRHQVLDFRSGKILVDYQTSSLMSGKIKQEIIPWAQCPQGLWHCLYHSDYLKHLAELYWIQKILGRVTWFWIPVCVITADETSY